MSEALEGFTSYAPKVLIQASNTWVLREKEKEKYLKMWERPEYRRVAPGEHLAMEFLRQAKVSPESHVIDFGSGTGRGALLVALMGQCKVSMVDFASNCLDQEVRDICVAQPDHLTFLEHDLTIPIPLTAKYGFCTDVMEHIRPEDVDIVLNNVLKSAQRVFFQISLEEDQCGKLIGEHLHLTVQTFDWWLDKFRSKDCVVYWSEKRGETGLFYVSCWVDVPELVKRGGVNTADEILLSNIEINSSRGFKQVEPHQRHDTELMMVAGGPSTNDFKEEIILKRQAGMPLVTFNGSYNEMIRWGLKPSLQIIVDAREFNKRFLDPIIPNCKYLLASQCHPSLFDLVPKDQLLIWHCGIQQKAYDVLDRIYDKVWYPIPGGSTVVLRSIVLLRLLGWWHFHVYGLDSCLMGDEHHAYSQSENDNEPLVEVTCGDKVFRCTTWMATQAQEFIDQMKLLSDEVSLSVYGEGLIAHILHHAANSIEE